MTLLLRVLPLVLGLLASASKLNLPRVLLPLFKTSSTNFTLRTTDNGCYRWTLSRLDIIQIIPLDYDKELDCSSEVILSTITREFNKNTVIVLVEEVVTKEVLRCDVIVDVITSLNIVTKTRQLFVEESPEIFEVRAYDEQGNEFSTLEGTQFTWTITGVKSRDASVKNDVIKLINFKDSHYEIPRTVEDLDLRGLRGHVVLLEGVKTGTANITVELPHVEYRQVPSTTVQLNVIANLIIEPADTYVLEGDVIHYKLLQVKNGRFVEVPLPSPQYSLNIEDGTIAKQRRPWAVETLSLGQTKLVLSDVNSKMSNVDDATYLPSVTLNVVVPSYMNLVFLPHQNWITALHMSNAIAAELYDVYKHKVYIGPHAVVTVHFNESFYSMEKTRNGSYIYGYARETGIIHVNGECSSVRTDNNNLIKFQPVTAKAEITVYPGLSIQPSDVVLPWDPVESLKLDYQLNVVGGDGLYQWVISNPQVAVVTQSGLLKPRGVGQTTVTVSMQKNAVIQTTARVATALPEDLKIVRHSEKAELGAPIYLAIALYHMDRRSSPYKRSLFTNCTGFPFTVNIDNSNFFYAGMSKNQVKTPEDACATLMVVGKRSGNAVVTVSYISDGKLLKHEAHVSTYEPLRLLSPSSGRMVLTLGAQRRLVFSGGPLDSRDLKMEHTKYETDIEPIDTVAPMILVERVYGSGANEGDLIYVVTCQLIGDDVLTVKTTNKHAFEGMDSAGTTHSIQVICSHPSQIHLKTELSEAQLSACPPRFLDQNLVLDNRPIKVRVRILDDRGNEFDNATSVGVTWTLSNTKLGEVRFPGIVKLEEEDENRYRTPLYHYQVIVPASQPGSLEVTATLYNYRKTWFKRLRIPWQELVLDSRWQSHETLKLTLVPNLHVSSESVTIFNHPQNVGRVYITHGSGFYKIMSDAEQAAQINYSESLKSVDIVPARPANFTMTVRDECLNSDPIPISVHIITITDIQVNVLNKIEKGKSVNAYLTLIDSKGNVVTKQDLVNLKVEVDEKIIETNCNSEGKSDGRIVCLVTGLDIGIVYLAFKAGMGVSVVRSKSIRIQVYPPLQIYPRNITLVPGASLQLTTKGGPQPDCTIVYTVDKDAVAVERGGIVVGNVRGTSYVIGKAIGVKPNGEEVVYSVDTVRVNVVHLKGIRMKTPLSKIRSGASMPIWIEGVPEEISPLVLGSVIDPSLTFKWTVTPSKVVQVSHVLEGTGIKISDNDKVSMRLHALKPGVTEVSVKMTVPRKFVPREHSGRFSTSVVLNIFDDLQTINHAHSPMLLAPEMKFQLNTNKDDLSLTNYQTLYENANKDTVLNVTKNGLITTGNHYGLSTIQVDELEGKTLADRIQFIVKVARVQYMMLNVLPYLHIDPETDIVGVPKGSKLRFYVSYHDDRGNQFTATPHDTQYLLHKMEKVRLSRDKKDFVLDLLDTGVTVLKVYDHNSDIFPDYLKINTVPFVQPDNIKLMIGDFVCFHTLAVPENGAYSCVWNTSNEHALSINQRSGFAVAKSKHSNVLVSYSCSNNLQMVTTVDVFELQKIEISASHLPNLSNNGKRVFVPLLLLNEQEDQNDRYQAIVEGTCAVERSRLHYPYACDVAFGSGDDAVNRGSIFVAYPDYVDQHGHVCVIESKLKFESDLLNEEETSVALTVSWNRQESLKVTIPFKPAVSVLNVRLTITDQEPIDTLRVGGIPSILGQVRLIPSHEEYITITEEESETKITSMYSVHLRSAYLTSGVSSREVLSVYVVSEATDQNITVPLYADVHANKYEPPKSFSERIMSYFTREFLTKFVFCAILSASIYFGVLKFRNSEMYAKMFTKRTDDSHSFEMSRNKSNLSSPYQVYQRPSYNEIQFIYGRTPDSKSLRQRRN